MPRSLRACVLLVAMLVGSLAPAVAVCLHADGTSEMGCCATDDHCEGAALKRACCPCAPATPSDPPSGASATHVKPAAVTATSWSSVLAVHAGPIDPLALRAYSRLLAQSPPDPPWLLNASILI
jgi:hypothetical protein